MHYYIIITNTIISGEGFYNTFAGRKSESLGNEDEGPGGGELFSSLSFSKIEVYMPMSMHVLLHV